MKENEEQQIAVPRKIKILFLAANPKFTPPLKIDQEIKAITGKIRAAEYRDSIELISAWAVSPDDLQLTLLEHKPHIVHFSGHGETTGELILIDKDGNPKPVKPEAIQALFTTLKDNIRIVFFNTCYSRIQTQALTKVIDFVIGMNNFILDTAATIFAASFYLALAFGRTVQEAFDLGKSALLLEGFTDEKGTPELLSKKNSCPSQLLLIYPPERQPIKRKISFEKLKEAAFSNITEGLNREEGYFFKKYITNVYQTRAEAENEFSIFLKQIGKKCFIITGRAGKGKTSLLCHLSEQILLEPGRIPILLNSPELNLEKINLKEYINAFFYAHQMKPTFNEIGKCLSDERSRLVVIIDAINELEGEKVFSLFNKQITELLNIIDEKNYPILFCISCRSEFWTQFSNEKWVKDNIFEPKDGFENTTYELKDFEEAKIDNIINEYFYWYALKGKVVGDARLRCCDPIMLRYLCEAYSKRESGDKETSPADIELVDIGVKEILQKKEVFRVFANNIRERMFNRVKKLFGLKNDQKTLFKHTTYYLIHLAKLMMDKGYSHFTLEEAYEVAQKIGHPDGDLKRHEFYNKDNRSIFFMFIDEGVVLDKRGSKTYDFVFESYFEYSLGRYFALHEWPHLLFNKSNCDQFANAEVIREEFSKLLNHHDELLKTNNFTNLLGALEYTILELETDENYKQNYPELFLELIEIMMKTEQFIFRQKAFATLRETQLLMGFSVEQKEKKLQRVFNIFYKLTEKVDFVISWDLENTIVQVSKYEADFVINKMEDWAEEGTKIQPMFAAQILARISVSNPQKVIDVLLKLSKLKKYRENFWLARSLIFAAKEMGMNAKKTKLASKYIKKLRNMLQSFYEDKNIPDFTRGLALSALPFLSDKDIIFLEKIGKYLNKEKYTWAIWNLTYELREWSKPFDGPCQENSWIWDILNQIVDINNPHLNYAVHKTATSIEFENPGKADKILERVDNNYWVPGKFNGEYNRTKNKLTGIVYSPVYLEPSFNNHIECRERLEGILEKLILIGEKYFNWIVPTKSEVRHLRPVHCEKNDRHRDGSLWRGYLDDVQNASRIFTKRSNTINIPIGPSELRYESYEVALVSTGGVISAVDYVMNNPARGAWSFGRPPGHLANNKICILNNIAVGAYHAKKKYNKKRILIIDCDAHHGKHTHWVFRNDPRVIYFSMHIDGDYAREEGKLIDIGQEEGEGYNFNLPYPEQMGDNGYKEIIDKLLIPLAEEFKPELIMISAGFDGHFEDDLTPNCILSEYAYIHLAEKLRNLIKKLNIKIVGALEGGYGLQSLANSYVHMISVIGGWGVPQQKIGFVTGKEKYMANDITLKKVRLRIRRRIELMKKTKEKNPGYTLFSNTEYWNKIIKSIGKKDD